MASQPGGFSAMEAPVRRNVSVAAAPYIGSAIRAERGTNCPSGNTKKNATKNITKSNRETLAGKAMAGSVIATACISGELVRPNRTR